MDTSWAWGGCVLALLVGCAPLELPDAGRGDDALPDGGNSTQDAGVPDSGTLLGEPPSSCPAPVTVELDSTTEFSAAATAEVTGSCLQEREARAVLRLTLETATTVGMWADREVLLSFTTSCSDCSSLYGSDGSECGILCPPAVFVGELSAGDHFVVALEGPETDASFGDLDPFTVNVASAPFDCRAETVGMEWIGWVCTSIGFQPVCDDQVCEYDDGMGECDRDTASASFNRCVPP